MPAFHPFLPLDGRQDHQPCLLSAASGAPEPPSQYRQPRRSAPNLGSFQTVKRPCRPTTTTFDPQARAEANEVANRADVLCGHFLVVKSGERMRNAPREDTWGLIDTRGGCELWPRVRSESVSCG